MKKLLSLALCLALLCGLAACGAAGTSPQADGTETYVFTAGGKGEQHAGRKQG